MAEDRLDLDTVMDRLAEMRDDSEAHHLGEGADDLAQAILLVVRDRSLRPDHRARVYTDFLTQRERLEKSGDARLVDLIFWSEHVETLYSRLRRGRLSTFHYVRALEVTCRRCGYELLPVMGRMEELGRAWGGRDFETTTSLLSPDVVELETPGEPPPELRS